MNARCFVQPALNCKVRATKSRQNAFQWALKAWRFWASYSWVNVSLFCYSCVPQNRSNEIKWNLENYFFPKCLSKQLPLLWNALKSSWAAAPGPHVPLHKVQVKYSSASLDHICMQLSAEETLFRKPANYTRVAAAAFKVVCVQMRVITFVRDCFFVWSIYIAGIFECCNFAHGLCM